MGAPVRLTFIGITVDELRPEKLRGYGALDETGYAQVAKIRDDLERLVDQVAAYVRQGLGRDLSERLSLLETAHTGVETLSLLEKVVTRWQLVEFRPVLEMIISRLEAPSFEVAVFGRVSSGKSSLLNHIAGKDALPVGVTPVTAVPTRLASGDKPTAVVSFAESGSRAVALEHLWEYASEEGNPGNRKHVTGILVKLPSPRLREGVIFVDTPGVGSLALSGGAEALAYLPQCDLGVVLVDAASTLNEEDLALLRALYGAGIPAMVLLSKADLLAPRDRERMTVYIREQFRRELGLELPVHPVSIVGADESLLTGWYDKELTPLLDRHRSLTEASLRRKIANVRESVIAVLETLLTKRRGGGPEDHAQVDSTAARLLEGADEAIRQARGCSLDWSADRQDLVEGIPRLAADAAVTGQDTASESALARVMESVLARRGRAAHELITGLQETLARTLEALGRAVPLANGETASVRDFHASGLPVLDLDRVRAESTPPRPWWAGLIPSLAVWTTEHVLRDRLGPLIGEVVVFYDRQLQAWVKANVARLVELYETQASAYREQLRRLAAGAAAADTALDGEDLEADLRELLQAEGDEAGAVAMRSDGLVPEALRVR